MLLAKWTIKATTKHNNLTEEEVEYLMDILFDKLDAYTIESSIGYSLDPYDINIEVQDG